MLELLLIRPGATNLECQGRIRGTLDIPLNSDGWRQAECIAAEVGHLPIVQVYSSPCRAARETAGLVAEAKGQRVKVLEKLRNLNHGLWQGKRIAEVRQTQPKVYRHWQDHPETLCPPEGEPLGKAQERVEKALVKLRKKHKTGVVALVVSEPLATLVLNGLGQRDVGDLWRAEVDCGGWELIACDRDGRAVCRQSQ